MMKKKWTIIVVVIFCIIAIIIGTPYFRDVLGRHIGSVSSQNAIKRIEEALKDKYPDKTLTWMHGDYYDRNGKWNDFCYTSDYMVDQDSKQIISATYCDQNFSSIWVGNPSVEIKEKEYERKITLIKSLAADYASLIYKEAGKEIENITDLPCSLSIVSPYFNVDYDKELPSELQYGMKFDRNIPLDWELQVIVRNYKDTSYDSFVRSYVDVLEKNGFALEYYNFIFINDVNEATYIYNITADLLNTYSVDESMKQQKVTYGEYSPYGDETKY